MESTSSCAVCCEQTNKGKHAIVCCPNTSCAYNACKNCVRTYLLSKSSEPHCMKCNQPWNNYFMVLNLNKSFVEGAYTEHRRQILMEREKSRMPETMNDVNNFLKGEEIDETVNEIDTEIVQLHSQTRKLLEKRHELAARASALKNGKHVVETERKKFIMPCPVETCRGFLSTGYKCEACKNHACPDCLEVLSEQTLHVCDEDKVKTTTLIKNTTKPCPKCGERISKIEGCDQMWCVSCHTAFSWRTGDIDNGTVHNPHYYQFQRQNNAGDAVRNPGDVLCGGIPSWFTIRRNIRQGWVIRPKPYHSAEAAEHAIVLSKQVELLETIHRVVTHVTHVNLQDTRQAVRTAQDFRMLRVKYILNRIDEKMMSRDICSADKKRMRDNELLHIFELFSVVGIELFLSIQEKVSILFDIVNFEVDDWDEASEITTQHIMEFMKEKIDEFIKFIQYCNEQMRNLSISYNCRVMIIHIKNNACSVETEKSTMKQIKNIQNMENTI